MAIMDATNGGLLPEDELRYQALATRYEIEKKGNNLDASDTHREAITRSGSRLEKLHEIQTPILVVHGKEDSLVPIEHRYKTGITFTKCQNKIC